MTISISENNDNLAFSRLHCRPRPRPPPPGQRWQMQEPRSFGGKALVCWKSTICWHQQIVDNQKYLRWPNYVSCVCLHRTSPLCLLFLDDHTCVGDKKIIYLMFTDPLHRGHCDHESLFPWRPSSRISGREKSFYKVILLFLLAGGHAAKFSEKENLGSKLSSIVI